MSAEGWLFVAFCVVCLAAMRWVLPRFGIST